MPLGELDLCPMTFTQWLGVDVWGVGFVACDRDCTGAAITDAFIAIHALLFALRVLRLGGAAGPLRRAAARCLLTNFLWSATGAPVWWQPGATRPAWFETGWRANAMIQCALVHAWYSLAFAMLDGARASPSGVRVGRAVALAQATVGAASVWLPSCRFEHYVLFGGANVTPPLMTLWCTITWLSARHGLLRAWARAPLQPHPLVCGFICGFVMWAGNSAILVGRSGGLVYWAHSLFRRAGLDVAENTVEEMAIFHVFGLAGNECLFRAFLWMAEHEGRWGAVDGWLDRALAAPTKRE